MAETKGVTQYEVEIQKQLQKRTILLHVSLIRGPRGKKKMVGEARSKTPQQPAIEFKVVNCSAEPEVFAQFLRTLVHRGYLPLQYREVKKGGEGDPVLGDWAAVDANSIEGIEDVVEQEARFASAL